MKKIYIILYLILQTTITFAAKIDTLVINQSDSKYLTSQYFVELDEPNNSFTVNTIFQSKKFHTVTSTLPKLKYSKSVTWIKFNLYNNTLSPIVPITIGQSIIDDFDVYYQSPVNNQLIHLSSQQFKKNKSILTQTATAINWPITPFANETLFIRVKSKNSSVIPIEIHSYDEFIENGEINKLIDGAIIGIFLIMALYNLMLFASVGDKSYLYYVVYIVFLGLSQILLLGYGSGLFSTDKVVLNEYVFPLVRVFFGFSILLFADEFLQLRQNFQPYYKSYLCLYALYTLPLIAVLINRPSIAYTLSSINLFIVSLVLLYIGCSLYIKGFKPAKFFLIGWGLSLIAILVSFGRNKGILPYNYVTANILIHTAIVELVLFSTALADKINFYRQQNEEAQLAALKIAKENERLITGQNIILENKVKERTQELIETNQNLSVTIENLQSAQNQLVETEKMASLGQLTAGVAHEINNPINFVNANVSPLRLDFDELFELIGKYDDAINEPDNTELLNAVLDYKKKIDPEFIKEEIKALLNGIEDGANRTTEIVKSLRTFSRMDKLVLKPANINSAILNTLILLRSSIPHYIEIKPVLDKLEPLNCYQGKIDQMLVNLVDNSIQAIKAKKHHANESIIIISKNLPDHISIEITDTGIGMAIETKQRVFEPFFTTKEIGQGTGLGLSIVFGIIEKHKGTIDIQSTPGVGTTFLVTLPKNLLTETVAD
ncbi:MAG: 7TM diverse intracellular signaling domain-containing protein [Mucilaginibacter sp.]